MKQKSVAAASGFVVAALTASCGGGGYSSPEPVQPAACAAAQTTAVADFFMPYLIGAPTTTLVAVNASDFTDARTVAGSFGYRASHVLNGADLAAGANPNDLVLTNRRPHSLLWVQGGKWFRAPLRKADPALLTSVQISSETQVDGVCTIVTRPVDLGDPTKDLIFYSLAGPDNLCGNADDLRRLIHADSDAGSAAEGVSTAALDNSVIGFYNAQGQATGFLSFEFGALKLYDADFHNPMSKVLATSYFPLFVGLDFAIVQIDGVLRRVQADGQLLAVVHTTTPGFRIDAGPADADNVYFTEASLTGTRQGKLFRLPLNGLSPSVVMVADASNQLLARGLTQNKVIFITNPPNQVSGASLRAIDKTAVAPAAPVSIDTVSSGFFAIFSSAGPQGANIFYSRFDTADVQSFPSARARDDSGNSLPGLQDFDHSVWAGEASGASSNKDNGFSSYPMATHLLLAQDLTNLNNGVNGATLKSYRVSDGAMQTLTKLADPGGVGITALSAGPIGLGSLLDFSGSATHRDVFAYNLDNVAPPANFCRYVDKNKANEFQVP